MRKALFILAAVAAVGLAIPAASSTADAQTVVVKSGDRGHRSMHRSHRKVVVIKRGHRHHHNHRRGARVIVR